MDSERNVGNAAPVVSGPGCMLAVVTGLIVALVLSLFVAWRVLTALEDNNRFGHRELAEVPEGAPGGNEYQPMLKPGGADEGQFRGRLKADAESIPFEDVKVIDESIVLVGIAVGPVSDREFYTYKAIVDGKGDTCSSVQSGSGSSWGCGAPFEPSISGGSTQTDDEPVVNEVDVQGLTPKARWMRVELSTGHLIVTDVRSGFAAVEWVGDDVLAEFLTAYDANGELLWSDSPDW